MGKPITTTEKGICFAFPDVCKTPTPGGPVPIPYPNIGQLSDTSPSSVASSVEANGFPVVHIKSEIGSTTGDSAGSLGAVSSTPPLSVGGKVEFTSASESVLVEGEKVVRMFDSTTQNAGNAVGIVLGGVPTVLVGG